MSPEKELERVMATLRDLGIDPITAGSTTDPSVIHIRVRNQVAADKLADRGWDVQVQEGVLTP